MARKRRKTAATNDIIILPPNEEIAATARSLLAHTIVNEPANKYAPVKHLLCLIAAGESVDPGNLTQYNPYYIKRTLKRLAKQRFIEKGRTETGEDTLVLTDRGKRWVLKYALETLEIVKPKAWDGKWRMVIYDVARNKAALRNVFRSTLKRLGFYNVQESVWLYPYPCEKEIQFLRQYCGMGEEVIYVICHRIEHDSSYRAHFGLR